MGSQITASKTDLFLKCVRPFHPETVIAPLAVTEAMRYGSCIHAMLDAILRGEKIATIPSQWGIVDADGAKEHVARIVETLSVWCKAPGNPWGVKFGVVASEIPYATNLAKLMTRECGFDMPSHTYELAPGEIGGTFDVLLYSPDWGYVVLDLKTGDYGTWDSPGQLGQLKTLVMQARAKFKKKGKWGAAILHAPKYAPPVVYSEEVYIEESRRHLEMMRKSLERVGDGSLTPGDWCARCPAKEGCPADDGSLLARSGALVKMGTAELMREAVEPGQMHMFLQQFEALAKRAREALRVEVERGEIVTRPDGKVLVLRTDKVERLSKSSIVKALGKEEGEKVIQELRERGCVPETEETKLLAVTDK